MQATPQPESFATALNELTRIKDEYVVSVLRWYERHARVPMLLFRATGVLIILLSVSVPLLGVLEGFWRDMVLPIAALAIAGLTGLNTFFQWHQAWQGYRQTQYTLEYLLSTWELRMVEARHQSQQEKAIEMAVQATQQLLDDARAATSTETGAYFEKMKMPRTGQAH